MKLLRELQNIIVEKTSISDRDEWMDAVKKAYPDKASKIQFKGGVENGKHLFWAQIPGEDRAYGVYSMDDEEGEVLGESLTVTEAVGRFAKGGNTFGSLRRNKRSIEPSPTSHAEYLQALKDEVDAMSDDEVNAKLSDIEFANNLSAADAVFFMNLFNKKERTKAKRYQLEGNRFKYSFFEVFDTLPSSIRAKLNLIDDLDHGRINWENLETLVKSENKNILKRKVSEI